MGRADNAISLEVRHAQDNSLDHDLVDEQGFVVLATVTVICTQGSADVSSLDADEIFNLASGRLLVGDADEKATLEMTPGRWRIQVKLEPPVSAETVRIWISGA